MKKMFMCALTALLMLLVLTACGEGADIPTPSESPARAQSQAPAPTTSPTPTLTPTPAPTPTPTPTSTLSNEDILPFGSDFTLELYLSSGVGAWGTSLELRSDGTFGGEYTDFDMGDVGDGYPNGTMYICDFDGSFSNIQRIYDYLYCMELYELIEPSSEVREWCEDGTRYILSEPVGMEEGNIYYLYTPEAPTYDLSSDCVDWYTMLYGEISGETLGCYCLENASEDVYFFSYGVDSPSANSYNIDVDDILSTSLLGSTFLDAAEEGWEDEWLGLYLYGGSDSDYEESSSEAEFINNILSADLLGSTFVEAAKDGWGDEWMFLYIEGSSSID